MNNVCFDKSGRRFLGVLILCFVMVVLMLEILTVHRKTDRQTVMQTALDKSYPVYIDGVEVDPDNIDISMYSKVRVDDSAQKVYISTGG